MAMPTEKCNYRSYLWCGDERHMTTLTYNLLRRHPVTWQRQTTGWWLEVGPYYKAAEIRTPGQMEHSDSWFLSNHCVLSGRTVCVLEQKILSHTRTCPLPWQRDIASAGPLCDHLGPSQYIIRVGVNLANSPHSADRLPTFGPDCTPRGPGDTGLVGLDSSGAAVRRRRAGPYRGTEAPTVKATASLTPGPSALCHAGPQIPLDAPVLCHANRGPLKSRGGAERRRIKRHCGRLCAVNGAHFFRPDHNTWPDAAVVGSRISGVPESEKAGL
ncbi:hypothetical protein Bbelb_411860 [Branchiostoma belcheri]|nr:hypothetical protein Bbelb_411860 [Branchiostoma belcheri]